MTLVSLNTFKIAYFLCYFGAIIAYQNPMAWKLRGIASPRKSFTSLNHRIMVKSNVGSSDNILFQFSSVKFRQQKLFSSLDSTSIDPIKPINELVSGLSKIQKRWITGLSLGAIATAWIFSGNGYFTLGFLLTTIIAQYGNILYWHYNSVLAAHLRCSPFCRVLCDGSKYRSRTSYKNWDHFFFSSNQYF